MGTKIATYKGVDIFYDEFNRDFYAPEVEHRATQAQVEALVETHLKRESEYTAMPAFRFSWNEGSPTFGKITSYNAQEHAAWFRSDENRREKVDVLHQNLYEVTDQNKATLDQMAAKDKAIAELKKQREELKGTLTRIMF